MREKLAVFLLVFACAPGCGPSPCTTEEPPAIKVVVEGAIKDNACTAVVSAVLYGEDVPLQCSVEDERCECVGGEAFGTYAVTAVFGDLSDSATAVVAENHCNRETVEVILF